MFLYTDTYIIQGSILSVFVAFVVFLVLQWLFLSPLEVFGTAKSYLVPAGDNVTESPPHMVRIGYVPRLCGQAVMPRDLQLFFGSLEIQNRSQEQVLHDMHFTIL